MPDAIHNLSDKSEPHLPPQRLGELNRWILWKYGATRSDGSRAKPPVRLDGRTAASVSDPTTWASYAEAQDALLTGASHCAGLGLVLGEGVVGVDFDVDADDPRSLEVISKFSGTYVERSPNGRVHAFCLGVPKRTGNRRPAEVYDGSTAHYLTFTGDHIAGTSLEVTEQQSALNWFCEKYLAEPAEPDPATVANNPTPQSSRLSRAVLVEDADLIDLIRGSKQSDKFDRLFNGDFSEYASQSEADLALCGILAFWTNKDPDRMDRIFRQSELFRPEKWEQKHSGGRTYRDVTIEKGIGLCSSTYKPKAKRKAKADKVENEDEGQGLFSRVIETVRRDPELKSVRFDVMDKVSVLADGSQIPPKMVLELRRKAETPRRTVGAELAQSAIDYIARDREFDPLQEMLEALPAWDDERRLDTWLHRYLGAADDEVSRRCGRMWVISLIARAYKPGCQAKYVLVLQSKQDLGKSKLMARLAGSTRFFISMTGHELGAMNTKLAISKKWIGEFAELGKLPMSERNVVKAFISDTSDTFRPPYARSDITAPRRCVFVITENPDGTGWLNDPTGGVRWWPVPVNAIDFESFEQDRDQLLAEALVAFRAGEPWWNTTPIKGLLERQESLQREDDWMDDIETVLRNLHAYDEGQEVLLPQVIFGLQCQWKRTNPEDLMNWTQKNSERLSHCMKSLGFNKASNPVSRVTEDPKTGATQRRKVRPLTWAGPAG